MQAKPKGLYYCRSDVPTKEELAEAESMGIDCFRNARLVGEGDALEPAAVVGGTAPAGYAKMRGCVVKSSKIDWNKPKPESKPDKTDK